MSLKHFIFSFLILVQFNDINNANDLFSKISNKSIVAYGAMMKGKIL
jgi:hypothetical protein